MFFWVGFPKRFMATAGNMQTAKIINDGSAPSVSPVMAIPALIAPYTINPNNPSTHLIPIPLSTQEAST